MKNLDGFSCEEWLHIKYNYWKTTIEWSSTTMLPNETTTVKELLTILGQEKDIRKSYISIYQNWKNTEFTKISNTNELKQYLNSTITWILCITNNKWTYYDVATDQKKINSEELELSNNTIERTKSTLTDFNFEKYKNPGNMELLNGDIDSGDEYHIEPKTTVTVEDLIKLIKKIWDKNILISVDSAEEEETTDFIKTSEIPDRFKKCKITGWTITFGKKGTYYAVSTWFNPNETEDPE